MNSILPNANRNATEPDVVPDYKVPERLEIVREIPRNSLGKIDRKSLRATMAFANAKEIPGRRR